MNGQTIGARAGRAAVEGLRYLVAACLALAVDFALYVGLIRLADVNYLVAAPIGLSAGLAVMYVASVLWVFRVRRMTDARAEFAVFAAIGVAGLLLNQGVIYAGVEWGSLSPELAKAVSACTVFWFNFGCRKLLLFTRW